MSTVPPIARIVLYKHGLGYLEREGPVEGDATLGLNFKRSEVSDVLKSLIVLDLDGGHVASVAYDSTRPVEQLLGEVALTIPDEDGLRGLLVQLKGARVAVRPPAGDPVEGRLLGVDHRRREAPSAVVEVVLVALLGDDGQVRSFELHDPASIQVLDEAVRRGLDSFLRIQLSDKTKDARRFAIAARGEGRRTLRLVYVVEAPVWKASYRLSLREEGPPPMIQGWAIVNNTQDEHWEDVPLSPLSGLPVSFVHDLGTPRYIKRPVVAIKETAGVLLPEVEEGIDPAVVADAYHVRRPPAPAVRSVRCPLRCQPDPVELLARTAYLDARIAQVLRQVVVMRSLAARGEAQIQTPGHRPRRHPRRAAAHPRQPQGSRDRPSEKELRERFVRTLNHQEDRLEQIEPEITAQTNERDQCRAKIYDPIATLDYEADV